MAECHLGRLVGEERCLGGCGHVHLRPLLRCHFWNCGVLEDASVKKLHDVKVAAHNAVILTECVGFGDRDIGVLESVDNPVFAVDLVRCLQIVSTLDVVAKM